MAVQHGIWKIGEKPQPLVAIRLDSEALLEEQITRDISILNSGWMLIGRQVYTDFGKYIDLLAIDGTGSIIIIELKKHKTPRDVVAQAIDYAAWVEQDRKSTRLNSSHVAISYAVFCLKKKN